MNKRKKILMELLNYNTSLSSIKTQLDNYQWDSDELVKLEKKQINNILNKYLSNELSRNEIEEWANIIECRDDIEFENDEIKEIIYELANPLLTQNLTKEYAQILLKFLNK